MFIDVRESFEFAADHVAGAVNIPASALLAGVPQLREVPKDTPLVVYCGSGSRAAIAAKIFGAMGFTNVRNGINAEQVRRLIARDEA